MGDEPERVEPMREFFDTRAEGYEAHMRSIGEDGLRAFYRAVAGAVPRTREPIRVLDLGAGTGLELHGLFEQAPYAQVTCIDLSPEMLARLLERHRAHADRIETLRGSFLTMPLGGPYDLAVSVMAMHHYMHDTKRALYRRIRQALTPGGRYIEGDYVVSPKEERESLERYQQARAEQGIANVGDAVYHLDIPFSRETQTRLLQEAGFDSVELTFQQEAAAVLLARKLA